MSAAGIPTTLFANYEAWAEAGRPAGGIMPVNHAESEQTPERYRGIAAYWVALPTGQLWSPWEKAYSAEKGYHGEGWNISGPLDKLTVTPSIQVDGWHGWLTDGGLHT